MFKKLFICYFSIIFSCCTIGQKIVFKEDSLDILSSQPVDESSMTPILFTRSSSVLFTEKPNKITIMKKIKGAKLYWTLSPEEDVFRYNLFYSVNGGEFKIYNPGTITVSSYVEVYQNIPLKRVYVCLSDEADGISEAREVRLTVMAPPVITVNPSIQIVDSGSTATFTVVASSMIPLSYQWQKDTSNMTNGGRFYGVDTATLKIASVETSDQGVYRCMVTNSIGNVMSNEATITIRLQDLSLKAHWKLNDGSGITAIDVTGNGNTGTLINGPMWTNGYLDGSLGFDGIDDYVSVGTSNFGATSEITISFWIYATGSGTGYQTLIIRNRYFNSFGVELSKTTGKFRSGLRTAAGVSYLSSNSVLPLNSWHHFAVTYRSGQRAVYLDGVPNGSNILTGDLAVSIYTTTIGSNGAGGQFFQGRLDDVRIYNRSLSAVEILSLFNEPSIKMKSSTSSEIKNSYFSVFSTTLPGSILTVSPLELFVSSGPVGGLFNPNSKIYILKNTGLSDISWTVSKTAEWLDLSITEGTLALGSSIPVEASINSNANNLEGGITTDTLTFTNSTFKIPSIYNTEEYVRQNLTGNVKTGTVKSDETPVRESYFELKNLEPGFYLFCVSAIDFSGNESEKSNQASITIPNY